MASSSEEGFRENQRRKQRKRKREKQRKRKTKTGFSYNRIREMKSNKKAQCNA